MITIWGLAGGRGSTENCARGAFTSRNYSTREAAEQAYPDWTIVLYLVEAGKRTSWGPTPPTLCTQRPHDHPLTIALVVHTPFPQEK